MSEDTVSVQIPQGLVELLKEFGLHSNDNGTPGNGPN